MIKLIINIVLGIWTYSFGVRLMYRAADRYRIETALLWPVILAAAILCMTCEAISHGKIARAVSRTRLLPRRKRRKAGS